MEIDTTAVTDSPTIEIVHDGATITIDLLATSQLTAVGNVISSSRSFYDDDGRVIETENDYGLRSQTLYDDRSRVVESRNEVVASDGTRNWMVSRTLYDDQGRTIASTGRFFVRGDTLLGQNPTETVKTDVTVTIYDSDNAHKDRTVGTEQYADVDINDLAAVVDTNATTFGARRWNLDPASLQSVSETLYDAAGRVYRTVSGRVPIDTMSAQATNQSDALAAYDVYDGQPDRYADLALSSGVISDTLFDSRGRQYGSLSHPLRLVEDAGLAPTDFGLSAGVDYLVRLRSETLFDSYGRSAVSRSGLAQIETTAGEVVAIVDIDSVDTQSTFDIFGNVTRSEYITGGTIDLVDRLGNSIVNPALYDRGQGIYTLRSDDATVDSFTMTYYDDENRPVAEMQPAPGFITAEYNETKQTFEVDSVDSDITGHPYGFLQDSAETELEVGDLLPTKLYRYDDDDRLAAVELPAMDDPSDATSDPIRPRYEYAYDERGNQVSIVSPPTGAADTGAETRFAFNDRGQQRARALPLAFGSDGDASEMELDTWKAALDAWSIEDGALTQPDWTEVFEYDDRGRQVLHASFEGIVSENVYDSVGRLAAVNYYDKGNFTTTSKLVSQRDEFSYDSQGRRNGFVRYEASPPASIPTTATTVESNTDFSEARTEATLYDDRGRIIAEVSPEGIVGYEYDISGRMTATLVYDLPANPAIEAFTAASVDALTPDRLTSYEYDILGRLISVKEDATPSVTTDDNNLTATDHSFDLMGRMDSTSTQGQTAASVTTDYEYDDLGRLNTITEADQSGNTLASYDYTVRPDGKRTALDETHWFDNDADGNVDAGDGDGNVQSDEIKSTSYTWTYDSVGRLTDEVLNHWDDTHDQTENFTYDLTGNRSQLKRDRGNDGNSNDPNSDFDHVITYDYDANDRLIEELLDDKTASDDDTTTTYIYDATQQTSKSVTSGLGFQPVSSQFFAYNLQGRMASVTNDTFTGGVFTGRERTRYAYDSKSYRVNLTNEDDVVINEVAQDTWTETSNVEFLADHHNHTGYTQTIRETTTNADGSSTTTDYTFGLDEIAQRIVERSDPNTITSDTTHIFGHDGHGSVRVIYDLATTAASIAQVVTFAPYGEMLAVHDSYAASIAVTSRLSFLGYSGEHFDAKAQQQYLRARFYNPANGQFNRLDPFAGNMQDPQSLHKYTYVHGDPIGGIDPTGLMSLGTVMTASFISVGMASLGGAAYGKAKGWSQEQIFYANLKNSGAALAVTLGFFGVAGGLIGLGAATADALLFSSISFGVGGITWSGIAVAEAFKHGDGVDKTFATAGLLFSLVGIKFTHAAAVNQTQRQTAISGALLQRIDSLGRQNGKLSGTAGVTYDPASDSFYGGNSTTAGGNSQKVSAWVLDLYNAVAETISEAQRSMHMKCTEPRSLSAACPTDTISAADRARLNKMWSAVVRMKDAKPKVACESCDPVLEQLGVRDAYAPNTDVTDMGIVNWIIAGLFGEISDDEEF